LTLFPFQERAQRDENGGDEAGDKADGQKRREKSEGERERREDRDGLGYFIFCLFYTIIDIYSCSQV
jgi:hypothetical protein